MDNGDNGIFKSTNIPAGYSPSSSWVWIYSATDIRALLAEKFNLKPTSNG